MQQEEDTTSNICFQDSESDSEVEEIQKPNKEIITKNTDDIEDTSFNIEWDDL